MNSKQGLRIVGIVWAVGALAGCGGGGGGDPLAGPVTVEVPAQTATSAAAATSYVAALATVSPADGDALEPIAKLPDSLATDDTAEPRAVAD